MLRLYYLLIFKVDTDPSTRTSPLLGDSDGDGLADCVETNTGIYVSTSDTGTNPDDNDSDDEEGGEEDDDIRGGGSRGGRLEVCT